MNAFKLAKSAYSSVDIPLRSAQSTEYDAFAKVTKGLRDANTNSALTRAVHDNRSLWNLLAMDVVHPDNELPVELRAQIFNLADFTRRHSSKILSGAAVVEPLIEINRAIMAGLRQQGDPL